MNRKLSVLIAFLLALLMLSGCTAESFLGHEREKETQTQTVCFEEIEYVRPDMEQIRACVDALNEALQSKFGFEKICECIERFGRQYTDFETMYALATIRSCMDVKDEYYAGEYEWCMEADARLQLLAEEVYSACANSKHAWWLERFMFWEGFREEYRLDENEAPLGSYDDYFSLVEREVALLAEYRDIMAEPSIEIDGKVWDFDEYLMVDYERAYEAYYEKYNPILAKLYIELIETRRAYARILGYDSYADYAYAELYDRDYSPEQTVEYMGHIKRYMSALGREINESGLEEQIMFEPVDERELGLYLEALAETMGGSIEQAYDFMIRYHMYDFSMSPNKADSSFQTYLEDYNAPYIFLAPYGYTDDLLTLCHEFGHYADSYIRQNAYESIDLSEVYSQAMQLLGAHQLECVMTEGEHDNFVAMNLLDILSSAQGQTALAEFELRAYEMNEPSAEKLNELYTELLEGYGFVSGEMYREGWVDVSHLFENPFYVISYSVSASAALQIYEKELEEKGSGIACFVAMSESMISGLVEAAEYAGLNKPLSEKQVQSSAQFIRSRLVK